MTCPTPRLKSSCLYWTSPPALSGVFSQTSHSRRLTSHAPLTRRLEREVKGAGPTLASSGMWGSCWGWLWWWDSGCGDTDGWPSEWSPVWRVCRSSSRARSRTRAWRHRRPPVRQRPLRRLLEGATRPLSSGRGRPTSQRVQDRRTPTCRARAVARRFGPPRPCPTGSRSPPYADPSPPPIDSRTSSSGSQRVSRVRSPRSHGRSGRSASGSTATLMGPARAGCTTHRSTCGLRTARGRRWISRLPPATKAG